MLLVLLATPARSATPPVTAAPSPEQLIYLLEYVGSDYGAAVLNGAVVNVAEYGEALRLTKQIMQGYAARHGQTDVVTNGLRDLQQLIERKAPSDEVYGLSRRLLPLLTNSLGAVVRLPAAPSISSGKRLWDNDCTVCHGKTGAGDGPAATHLEPAPSAFGGELMDRLSPRQIFNALTFGIPATAMPSFADGYSEQQRWDVAFYVMTLRQGFGPQRPVGGTQLTAEEVAVSTNGELLARLRATRPAATEAEVDYLRLNAVAASGAPGATAPATAPAAADDRGLAAALQLQEAFARVAERVRPAIVGVTAFVLDPEWTEEKQQASRGNAWMANNRDAFRYPGFRPVRAGSGFLIEDEGYVLSSDQLLRDANGQLAALIDLELADETHAPARIVGTEPTVDLSVLRLPENVKPPLAQPLELGNSGYVEAGHWVIALANPPGAETVFSVGVVASAPVRQCYQEELSATALQTSLDVPLSGVGGPVVDIQGRVLGLTARPRRAPEPTTLIDAPPPRAVTLPINLVLNLFEALKVAKSSESPWLGISVLELPTFRAQLGERAATTKIPPTGLYIDNVYDPSPAARLGVRPGDFLVGLGGHRILSVSDFQTWLYVSGIGSTIELSLVRDGAPLALTATVETRPDAVRPR